MKILRNFLIVLLAAIVLLCGLIGLSVLKPDLFEAFMKKPSDTSELAAMGGAAPSATVIDEEDPEPVAAEPAEEPSDTVSSDIPDEPPEDSDPETGLKKSISSSYVPGGTEQTVSDALKTLTGYKEPEGTRNILDKEKADKIESTLSTGPTGDDLSFDQEFYPYYHMLDEKGQHLYRQIYANANELNDDFKAVEKDISWTSLMNVFEAVFNDHPELFWLNTEYSAGFREGGDCLELILSFNRTSKNLSKAAKDFDSGADKLAASGAEGSDYDKEKNIHNAICDAFSYSLKAEMNQSAYSGIVNSSTVCAGYARAFQYIMTNLGIPCYYCRGVAGEPHAWNIIKLDGDYYNVDVTWDDSSETWQYEYFNMSDEDISKDHRRTSLSVYLPACKGGKYGHLEEEPADESDYETGAGEAEEEETSKEKPAELPDGTYVDSLEQYYDLCRQKIESSGKGSYSFDLYTTDKSVYNSCMRSYADGSAKSGYMNEIFKNTPGAKGFSVDFTGSESDGVYRMTQKVRLY